MQSVHVTIQRDGFQCLLDSRLRRFLRRSDSGEQNIQTLLPGYQPTALHFADVIIVVVDGGGSSSSSSSSSSNNGRGYIVIATAI
jgi:hypothetical protein